MSQSAELIAAVLVHFTARNIRGVVEKRDVRPTVHAPSAPISAGSGERDPPRLRGYRKGLSSTISFEFRQ